MGLVKLWCFVFTLPSARNLEAERYMFIVVQQLWYLTDVLAADTDILTHSVAAPRLDEIRWEDVLLPGKYRHWHSSKTIWQPWFPMS